MSRVTRRQTGFITVIAMTTVLSLTSPVLAEGTREIVRGGRVDTDYELDCGDTVTDTCFEVQDARCYQGSGGSGSEGSDIAACPYQGLRSATRVFADVIDDDEFGVWCSGKDVDIEVFAPNGESIGTFERGDRIEFSEGVTGAYRFALPRVDDFAPYDGDGDSLLGDMNHKNELNSVLAKFPWDIQIFDPACGLSTAALCPSGMGGSGEVDRGADCEANGRVFATQWIYNAGSFASGAATSASYYAIVPGGAEDATAVLQLDLDGLSGFVYEIWGNRLGVAGQGGRSVHDSEGSFVPEFRMYLNPPEDADYEVTTPQFNDGPDVRSGELCSNIVSPNFPVFFDFESNVEGTIQLICDLNNDGDFNLSNDEDIQVFGVLEVGSNSLEWDVTDNNGDPLVDPGDEDLDLECVLRLTVGEFHYVGHDMETSFDGFRMWEVDRGSGENPTYTRTSVEMHWNDEPVQHCAVTMPNNETGAETSNTGDTDGDDFINGVDTGDYDGAVVPHTEQEDGNARSWGRFASGPGCGWPEESAGDGKGNDTYLDTLTWLSDIASSPFTLKVIPRDDADSDGLFDYVEQCITGTDFEECDTDGDSVNDFIETNGGEHGIDTDDDGVHDGRDDDDDNDCIPTRDEAIEDFDTVGPVCLLSPDLFDFDNDGDDNYLDTDDDGDNVATIDEGNCDDEGGGFTEQDTDDDDAPDHLDPDDDGDGVPTKDEDVENVNDDPMDDDTDDDGTANYLDVDDDDDCILTILEDPNGDQDPTTDDTDLNDVPNYLDDDDDGDLVPTILEGECNEDDLEYTEQDTDEDDDPDHLDVDDDGDDIDTEDEDVNEDGDPTNDDTDGDGTPNYLDLDDDDGPLGDRDGDGVPNEDDNCPDTPNADQSDVDDDGEGDVCDDDADDDGIENDDDNCWLDPNTDQANMDDDDEGDVCDNDRDGDGVPNADDNCPDTPNADQEDVNLDGIGDICQEDSDGDGIPDVGDNCPDDPNTDQGNIDGDEFGDVCDDDIDGDGLTNDEETDTYGTDPYMADTDGGGVPDGEEVDDRTDPLDPGDDPGAYEVSGGSVFTCSAADNDVAGMAWIAMILGALCIGLRRRE